MGDKGKWDWARPTWDIKIDKDRRFVLKQEMKEMDRVVFHTSHSLSIPLRHPHPTPPHHPSLHHMLTFFGEETRQPSVWNEVSGLRRWWRKITYSNHQTTHTHTLSPTLAATLQHTDMLLKGCHDNSLKFPVGERVSVCVQPSRVISRLPEKVRVFFFFFSSSSSFCSNVQFKDNLRTASCQIIPPLLSRDTESLFRLMSPAVEKRRLPPS